MKEFSHRVYSPWCQRIYWNNNVAGDESNATTVVVKATLGARDQCIEFLWPSQAREVKGVELMLELAYELGRNAAKEEIRKTLGIK